MELSAPSQLPSCLPVQALADDLGIQMVQDLKRTIVTKTNRGCIDLIVDPLVNRLKSGSSLTMLKTCIEVQHQRTSHAVALIHFRLLSDCTSYALLYAGIVSN